MGLSITEAKRMNVDHNQLIHELTAMDRRDSKKRGYNRYALAQYFEAADTVETLQDFVQAFTPTRGTHRIAKNLELPIDVERGRWIILDTRTEAEKAEDARQMRLF